MQHHEPTGRKRTRIDPKERAAQDFVAAYQLAFKADAPVKADAPAPVTAEWPNMICPCCRRPTEHLKHFALCDSYYFFLIGSVWTRNVYVGCPSCMRECIKRLALANLLSANLAWPLAILPNAVVQTLRSYLAGYVPPPNSTDVLW